MLDPEPDPPVVGPDPDPVSVSVKKIGSNGDSGVILKHTLKGAGGLAVSPSTNSRDMIIVGISLG